MGLGGALHQVQQSRDLTIGQAFPSSVRTSRSRTVSCLTVDLIWLRPWGLGIRGWQGSRWCRELGATVLSRCAR